jgi:hypothetical protein
MEIVCNVMHSNALLVIASRPVRINRCGILLNSHIIRTGNGAESQKMARGEKITWRKKNPRTNQRKGGVEEGHPA